MQKVTANTIHNAKRKLEKELAYNSDKNGKKFTKYIKSKSNNISSIGPQTGEEGNLIVESKLMADELNNFFMSVFTMEN